MGIKFLNRYLKNHCSRGIQSIPIEKLRHKTVVVDTSIYIYKFLETNSLLENFFTFITQCHAYEITPLFIFDGKPDDSKLQTILTRYHKRKEAMEDYYQCKHELETSTTISEEDKVKMILKMEQLKKESIRVKEKHIVQVKQLFDAMKVNYWEASGEADILCAYFVKNGLAWACVSDDMDMFIYDCNFVIREWDIETQQCMLYERSRIIRELNVDERYFSAILVILGTDYHQESKHGNNRRIFIDTALNWYDQYYRKNHKLITNPDCFTVECHSAHFYKWLAENGKITMSNRDKLSKIYSIFIIPDTLDINPLSPHICYPNKESMIQWDVVKSILTPLGFLFPTPII
jgi:flap endonuclease-1